MGIRQKIRLGFFALGLLLFFSGLMSYFELNKLSNSTRNMLDASLKNMELSKEMLDAVQDQNTALLQIMVTGSAEYDSLLFAGRAKFDDPPFLLVDRIFHCDSSSVAGIKNVTMNEPFFVGHFPEEPVMPGVLIVEAMAQCSGIMVLSNVPDPENYSTYFMKIDGVKFKRKVVPGDTLQFEIHLLEPIRRGVALVEAKAFVGETLACEAVMMAQVVKNKK